jgi:hypothetical protein
LCSGAKKIELPLAGRPLAALHLRMQRRKRLTRKRENLPKVGRLQDRGGATLERIGTIAKDCAFSP